MDSLAFDALVITICEARARPTTHAMMAGATTTRKIMIRAAMVALLPLLVLKSRSRKSLLLLLKSIRELLLLPLLLPMRTLGTIRLQLRLSLLVLL